MNNSNEVKRTPGEWKVNEWQTKNGYECQIETDSISAICTMMQHNYKANAEFICKAVNEYDKIKEDNTALLDAAKKVLVIMERIDENFGYQYETGLLLSAIQKAESK